MKKMQGNKKKTTSSSSSPPPYVLSLTNYRFDFTLKLDQETLERLDTDFSKIATVKDLKFLESAENKDLLDCIQISTGSFVNNLLLYINKCNVNRSFVNVFDFNSIKLPEEESFLKKVMNHVTEHNYFFHNEVSLFEEAPQVSFQVKFDGQTKSIPLSIEKKETNTEKEGDNPFDSLKIDYSLVSYFLIDLDEIINLQISAPNVLKDFQEYLKVVITENKNVKIVMNYPNIMGHSSLVNLDSIAVVYELLAYTDIFVFEKKEALALFNMLNHITHDKAQDLEEKDVVNFFKKEIKFARLDHTKIGLFLEEFQRLTVVEVTHYGNGSRSYSNQFEFQLHPKINHTNLKLVDQYKSIIAANYSFLKSVFLSGFFSILFNHNKGKSDGNFHFYPAFLQGSEISKRMLELMKNKIEFPQDGKFYLIKLPISKVQKEIEKEINKRKEEKFVLDCINKKSSKLKYYNPLYDNHLNSFFASDTIKKQLKDKGFINTNGFIMYDPTYRAVMGPSPQRKRFDPKEKEKQLLYAIKSISSEDQDSSQLDSHSKMMKSNSPTSRRIPTTYPDFVYIGKSKGNSSKSMNKKHLKPITREKNNSVEVEKEENVEQPFEKKSSEKLNESSAEKVKENQDEKPRVEEDNKEEIIEES